MNRASPKIRRRGLSLPEVLISLAITATLLVAVGAGFSAAAAGIEINDRFSRATQAARVSVNQITSELRNCQSGEVDDDSLELTTASGEKRLYSLDTTNHELKLTLLSQLTTPSYRLASNVSSVSFDTDGKTVAITVTVNVENQSVTISGSAFPRRAMVYQ